MGEPAGSWFSSASTWLLERTKRPLLFLTSAPNVPAITNWLAGSAKPTEQPGWAGRMRVLGSGIAVSADARALPRRKARRTPTLDVGGESRERRGQGRLRRHLALGILLADQELHGHDPGLRSARELLADADAHDVVGRRSARGRGPRPRRSGLPVDEAGRPLVLGRAKILDLLRSGDEPGRTLGSHSTPPAAGNALAPVPAFRRNLGRAGPRVLSQSSDFPQTACPDWLFQRGGRREERGERRERKGRSNL